MKSSETTVASIHIHENSAVQLQQFSTQPAAGFPSPGDDMVERSLSLDELLVTNETATFFVRVSGDSMEGAHIYDGDILVVDRSRSAAHGSIVVAAVYGELVVKKLRQTNTETALLSANAAYEPIVITDNEDVHIWGVVTGSVRSFV